ncbi:unnamed protein product [Clonostachys solani]|uniref:Cytochrome P450 n=1 Tax=Clonostachys solani TaxID=160281 RepID=A0A9P0EM61_9HYPO|nr:unnamed protein product [Clonostachys solani]
MSTYHFRSPLLWKRHSVHIRSLFHDIYIIQGDKSIVSLFSKNALSSGPVNRTLMVNVFGLPKTAAETYSKDDSGEHRRPIPGSKVPDHNRVAFLTSTSRHRFFLGRGYYSLLRRLHFSTIKRLSSLDVGCTWSAVPDLFDIFRIHLTAASIDSFTGPTLMERNPSFANDISAIKENLLPLMLGLPRFLMLGAYQARDRALEAVLDWHAWARQNSKPESVDADENEHFWGCDSFREKQTTLLEMDGFDDPRALASEDLFFLWSAQGNSIGTAFWLTLQTFRDPEILQAVRDEVGPCVKPGPDEPLMFNVDRLMCQPLLQAMFAEVLRLRTHGYWTIPKHSLCVASSTTAAMDPQFWCAGDRAGHPPVHEFFPGRFLKTNRQSKGKFFNLSGLHGHSFPFGGEPFTCPGRVYAKHENLVALATMVTMYDCEVLAWDEALVLKTRSIPGGTADPSGKVPVRLRRRKYPLGG